MKAMIFAAGLGQRLKPYTNTIPKALVPVNNRPMLEWVILNLKKFEINNIIINVHHFADKIIRYLNSKDNFGIQIAISMEDKLLDTGGGLKKAAWFFEGENDFIVHNTDIITDIDLHEMYLNHLSTKSDVTLCTRTRDTNRYLLFNSDNILCGWQNKKENDFIWVDGMVDEFIQKSFCGIHILSTKIINKLNTAESFPIIDDYLRLAKKYKITSFDANSYRWSDLGKAENIEEVANIFPESYFSALKKFY